MNSVCSIKRNQKLIAVILALVMILSLSASSFSPSAFASMNESVKISNDVTIIEDVIITMSEDDVSPMDMWTLSRTMKTSQYINTWTIWGISNAMFMFLGGPTAAYWYGLASTAYTGITQGNNVYYDIYFYWVPSGDPYSPYYVRKVILLYADSEFTEYLGWEETYYYSTAPW